MQNLSSNGNGLYDDDELRKLLESGKELEGITESHYRKVAADAENKVRLHMYDVGDFDPRHYRVSYEQVKGEAAEGESRCRIDLYMKIEYVGNDRQKKKAVNILKKMYGKDFKKMVVSLHKRVSVIMGDEEFGKMITEDDIINEFIAR